MKVKVKAVVSDTSRPMKESGVEWIGLIPENWSVYPARFAFSEEKTKNVKGTIKQALKFFNGTIIPKDSFDADLDEYVAETITNYTVVKPNTIMINGLNLNYDLKSLRVGLVNELGVITSAYLALIPDTSRILPTYATYLFKGYETKMAFHNMGSGIRKTLGFKEFKHQPILIPPLREQAIISDYLDKECARIDSVIEKTRESIEEYEKLKQSIITQAVTKGIRPARKMRNSGMELVGNIPEEWKTPKMGIVCNVITDYVASGSFASLAENVEYLDEPDYAMLIRTADVSNKGYNSKPVYINQHAYEFLSNSNLVGGELMFPNIGASVGDVYIIPNLYKRMSLAPNSIMVKTNFIDKYYYYYFKSEPGRLSIEDIARSTAQAKFNKTDFRQLKTLLPSVQEQEEIVQYLDDMVESIDILEAEKEKLIVELESYKKAIVFECVTGKKEVQKFYLE